MRSKKSCPAASNNIRARPPEPTRKGRFDEVYSVVSSVGALSTGLIKAELQATVPLSRHDSERTAELRQWVQAYTIKA